jgi:hypothetical protein
MSSTANVVSASAGARGNNCTVTSNVVSEASCTRGNIRANWDATIRKAFESDPHVALTTKDLVMLALDIGLDDITRSQRVAAARAMKAFTKKNPRYPWLNGEGCGGQLVIFDSHDVLSYGLARMKGDWVFEYQVKTYWNWPERKHGKYTDAQLRERLVNGREAGNVSPGGCWWRQVELWKAEDGGDRLRAMELERDSIVAAVRSTTELGIRPRASDLERLQAIETELRELKKASQ